ncbi:MAG: hypothetical protein V1726_06540 [Methanobacteriota archaeon]
MAKDTMNAESEWGTIDVVMPMEVHLGSATQQFFQSILLGQRLST